MTPGSNGSKDFTLEDLYALIPEMQCIDGCTDCCRRFGVPSRTPLEDARIRAYLEAQGRDMGSAQGTTCPYLSEHGCTIYPVRPFTCRLFGTSPNYRCPHGARPLELLHEDLEAEIFARYQDFFPRLA
ncbi:Putative zinc-or iron-chelating domain-containing protein [Desulfacinum hydrothermale DSM 13146]|uniref:Putative zinc-or iron-chelating domain-containing protein n=1 Tax=Desulfacinum hydrothermale DSM 13146 TaxID=1121390 RepID=A0A1W1XMD0_9BACT|nr:YkgJ family cysteine cluster protein [Desulfacinum hydrothermale]SMC25022.1 Putative zinc-or iron-chelating domain-containing protein [Desulfacinum hydrothermale DSM 13146]